MNRSQLLFSYLSAMIVLLSSGIFFTSCDNDDDDDNPVVLSITNFEPTTAKVGDTITITGTGFNETASQNKVEFTALADLKVGTPVISASATSLVVKVPEGAQDGPIFVTVGKETVSSPKKFVLDVSLGGPVLVSLNPANGFINAEVVIDGTNFGEDVTLIKVYFGKKMAEVSSVNNKKIVTKVPELGPGVVDVKVVRDGVESKVLKFTIDPTPVDVRTVYWTSAPSDKPSGVYKGVINENGAAIELLYETDAQFNGGIVLDGKRSKIYWIGDATIYGAPIDGKGTPEVLLEGDPSNDFPGDVALDAENNKLYLTYSTTGEYDYIMTLSLEGEKKLDTLYSIPSGPGVYGLKLAISGDKLYWTENFTPRVAQGSIDGKQEAITLFDGEDGLEATANIAIDSKNGKIFITEIPGLVGGNTDDKLLVGNLDGSGDLKPFIEPGGNLKSPLDIEIDVDNGYLLWISSDTDNGQVMRAKLDDGSSVEVLFEGEELGTSGFFDLDIR